ncbi:hypothetical protein PoB_005965100 [Plakobranchus ocellatus]|uniref:Uncharacterized protein n=1 Tax=Plakobranchus ocellatus TaxID=259542 RepID=A0AAV4CCV2_9GAST|nr:hypothetical protein PoB_005965100 [Plakobranchus ocellatus]
MATVYCSDVMYKQGSARNELMQFDFILTGDRSFTISVIHEVYCPHSKHIFLSVSPSSMTFKTSSAISQRVIWTNKSGQSQLGVFHT